MSAAESSESKKYVKLSHTEHILLRPNMYIGDIKSVKNDLNWVYDKTNNKMIKKPLTYNYGFIKIFDEVLMNAIDHSNDSKNEVSKIELTYDKKTGEISIYNNGLGIPCEIHDKYNMYIPELIFGNLLSGSNYDDSKKRTSIGLNGLGVKCISLNTIIPLFNGNIKLAKDIKVGDILIGDDGNKRTVTSIIFGKGKMYEINQNRGESYEVNKKHMLTLHMPDHKVIFWCVNGWRMYWWEQNKIKSKFIKAINNNIKCEECGNFLNSSLKRHYKRKHPNINLPHKQRKLPNNNPDMNNENILKTYNEICEFSNNINDNNVFDISVKDYLKLSKTTKSRLAGVRGNCVNWEYQKVDLDPYILGLWLGDGCSDGENDYQIINYLKEWGLNNDTIIKQSSSNK
jgi:hypothetical protein